MGKNSSILVELEEGLSKLEEKLNGLDDCDLKLEITENAKNQLRRAQTSSLVKGTILVIDLVDTARGQAWSVLHDDNGNQQVRLYYFSRHVA